MNSLSWLIYLSDMLGGAKITISIGIAIVGLAAVVLGIASAITASDAASSYATDADKNMAKNCFKYLKGAIVLFALLGTLSVFIPSKNTVMLIAASQVGQEVLLSDQGQKVTGEIGTVAMDSLKLLQQYLEDQVKDQIKDATSSKLIS